MTTDGQINPPGHDLDQRIRTRIGATSANPAFATRYQLTDALRAVLNLHRPNDGDCTECGIDGNEDPIRYPCATVRSIARELDIPLTTTTPYTAPIRGERFDRTDTTDPGQHVHTVHTWDDSTWIRTDTASDAGDPRYERPGAETELVMPWSVLVSHNGPLFTDRQDAHNMAERIITGREQL